MKTPVCKVLFNNLKTPSVFKGNKAYDVIVSFNPTSVKSHAEFIAEVNRLQLEATGGQEATYPVVKPRRFKNKDTGQLENHADEVQIKFKNKEQPVVINSENVLLEDEALVLPFGTMVELEIEFKAYDFQAKQEDGSLKQVKGISPQLKKVKIVNLEKKPTAAGFTR